MQALVTFSIFYLTGIGLMAASCFLPYTPSLSVSLSLSFGVWALCYFLYYTTTAPPKCAFFNWVYLAFLFPKKAVPEQDGHLLSSMIGRGRISVYEILETVVILTLVVVLLRTARQSGRLIRPKGKLYSGIFVCWSMLIFVGIVNFAIVALNGGPPGIDLLQMWRAFWPLLLAGVVWKASARFLESEADVDRIMRVAFVAAIGLMCEFALSSYGNILPGSVIYYEFGPGFRSAWQSTGEESGLLVGLLLIAGIGAAYARWSRRNTSVMMALIILCLFVSSQTYNRAGTCGALAALLATVWLGEKSLRLPMAVVVALGVAFGASDLGLKYQIQKALKLEEAKGGENSYFETYSLLQRLGNAARGVEVFLAKPLFGAGPGNLPVFIPDPAIEESVPVEKLGQEAAGLYDVIRQGQWPTNSHNLLVDLAAEYGLAGLIAALVALGVVCKAGFALNKALKGMGRVVGPGMRCSIGAYGVVVGMCVYYCFQAVPLVYGLFAVMLRIAVYGGALVPTVEQTGKALLHSRHLFGSQTIGAPLPANETSP